MRAKQPICPRCKVAPKAPRTNYCLPCKRAYYREYNAKNRDRIRKQLRAWHLRNRYGVEPDEVPNGCQVCGSEKKICVDHCHASGKTRGFLCDRCNLILGRAKDSSELLEALAEYIRNS